MKKSFFSKAAAALAAGAMVLGMATAVFAVEGLGGSGDNTYWGAAVRESGEPEDTAYDGLRTKHLTDEQRASIAAVEFVLDVGSDLVRVGGGYNENGTTWKQAEECEFKGADGEKLGTQTYVMEVSNYALNQDGSDSIVFEVSWINAISGDYGYIGTIDLIDMVLKDSAGNIIDSDYVPAAPPVDDGDSAGDGNSAGEGDVIDTPAGDGTPASALILASAASFAAVAVSVKKFASEK